MPEVGCCILARPTKKMGLFRQMIGRVLRPATGKVDAIVLDHSGAVFRHGFVEDHVEWTLDPDRRADKPDAHSTLRDITHSRLLECTQCGADPRRPASRVGHCGFLPQRPPRAVPFIDGDLGEVGRDRRVNPTVLRSARARTMARHAGLYRHRARLQARLGRVQVQREIRQLAAVGSLRRADPADAGSPLLGALAADRLRQGEGFLMIRPRMNGVSTAPDPVADAEYVLAALRCTSRRLKLINGQIIEIGVALSRGLISPQAAIDWCEEVAPGCIDLVLSEINR